MNLVDIDKAKKCEGDDCVRIVLDKNNISKFPIQTLYCKERGFRNFLLEYNYENLPDSFEKISYKLRNQIFSLVKDHSFRFYISGFPRCVFESEILIPEKKSEFRDSVFYYDKCEIDSDKGKDYYRCESCGYRNRCLGLDEGYISKHGFEYGPLASNEDLIELYNDEFEFFYDTDVKKYYEICSEDLKNSDEYGEKKIFFKKRISSGSDEFKEGFFYRIFTYSESYEELISLLNEIFGNEKIEKYHTYLKKASTIVLGFEVLSDDVLRKRVYVSTDKIDSEEKDRLFKKLNFESNSSLDLKGIYLEENEEDFSVVELAYGVGTCDVSKVKELFKDSTLEQKRLLLKFLNSLTKKLNDLVYCEKYDSGLVIAKKIEIFMVNNPIKIKNLGILYATNLKFYDDKEMLSIVFEVSEYQSEKVIFNYSMKLPEPELEEESDFYDDEEDERKREEE